MKRSPDFGSLRLAAIDLDGTLLAPDLSVSGANRRAIQQLQAANLEVVIASGRHYSSILPFAVRLPGVRWILSSQGGEVSDVARSVVLHREFLPPARLRPIIELGDRLGLAAVFYTPDSIHALVTSTEGVEFYTHLSGVTPTPVNAESLMRAEVHKVVWIGSPSLVATLASDPRIAGLELQTVQTHARLFELLPVGVTKASGLAILVRHLGMSAKETVVFGDADNDIPMFEWAGESVAMPHGWPLALKSAHWVGPPGPPEEAFARAVDFVASRYNAQNGDPAADAAHEAHAARGAQTSRTQSMLQRSAPEVPVRPSASI